jgi:hypothetical protein
MLTWHYRFTYSYPSLQKGPPYTCLAPLHHFNSFYFLFSSSSPNPCAIAAGLPAPRTTDPAPRAAVVVLPCSARRWAPYSAPSPPDSLLIAPPSSCSHAQRAAGLPTPHRRRRAPCSAHHRREVAGTAEVAGHGPPLASSAPLLR